MVDLASLWSSRVEGEQSGNTTDLSPEIAVFLGQLWAAARCMTVRSTRISSLNVPVRDAANEAFQVAPSGQSQLRRSPLHFPRQ